MFGGFAEGFRVVVVTIVVFWLLSGGLPVVFLFFACPRFSMICPWFSMVLEWFWWLASNLFFFELILL